MFKFGTPPPLEWKERQIPKRSGGVRILEIPCLELRKEQRRILQYMYEKRDAGLLHVSNVAHGFLPYRSVSTAVLRHSLAHAPKQVLHAEVLRLFPGPGR